MKNHLLAYPMSPVHLFKQRTRRIAGQNSPLDHSVKSFCVYAVKRQRNILFHLQDGATIGQFNGPLPGYLPVETGRVRAKIGPIFLRGTELLAIYFAAKKFRPYLYGRHFTI